LAISLIERSGIVTNSGVGEEWWILMEMERFQSQSACGATMRPWLEVELEISISSTRVGVEKKI
jgi:hypothetical protein